MLYIYSGLNYFEQSLRHKFKSKDVIVSTMASFSLMELKLCVSFSISLYNIYIISVHTSAQKLIVYAFCFVFVLFVFFFFFDTIKTENKIT